MTATLRKLLVALMALSLIAAACGSDDDDTSTDAGTTTTAAPADSGDDDDSGDDSDAGTTAAPADSGDDDDSGDDGDAMDEIKTDFGVDVENKVIRVGLNTDLSGIFAPLTTVITEGQVVFWEEFNANGGIDGWTVEPVILDNAYDVPTHKENYDKFSGDGNESVVMLATSTGSPHTASIAEDLVADDMMAIPLSWYSGWTDPTIGQNVFEVQANYCVEAMNGVDYLSQQHGNKVAVVGFPGDYGEDGGNGAVLAAEMLGLEVVFDGRAQVIPGADPTPVITGIVESGADFVWLTTNPTLTAQLIGGAAAAGYTGQWSGNSPSWNPALLGTDLAPVLDASYTHSTYTLLWGQGEAAGMSELVDTMQRLRPDAIADDTFIISWIQGYITSQTLAKAIENGDLTRAGVLAAANSIEVDLMGLAPNQSWGGSPDDSIVRGTYLYDVDLAKFTPEGKVTDADANRGYTLLEADYESPLATAWTYEPCFLAG